MASMKLSAVINTKNSSQTLKETLESIRFADEIVVVDMESQDNTRELARQYTDHVFTHKDVGYVEPARNFALSKAKGEWILVIDSDEVVSPGLKRWLEQLTTAKTQTADCYYIPRKNIIFGTWVKTAGWWPDPILRVFRRGQVHWQDKLHSVPITKGEVVELPADSKLALVHYHYRTVEEFVERLNRYSSIQAKERSGSGAPKASAVWQDFSGELLSRLFARDGVSGGVPGLGLSLLQAFSQTVVALKVWEKNSGESGSLSSHHQNSSDLPQDFVQEITKFRNDLGFWLADWKVKHSGGLMRWWYRAQRWFYRS